MYAVPELQRGRESSRERLRWLVSANMNSCGANAGEIGRGVSVPFLRWQYVLALSSENVTAIHTHSDCVAATGSPRLSSFFLAPSIRLSFASLVLG